MNSQIEEFELEAEEYTSPWKRLIFEVALVLAVMILFGLIGISAYRAVEEELNYQQQLGGDLLITCQRIYRDEVFDPEMDSINTEALNGFYENNKDCKIFNVTDLDPLFFQSVQ